MGRYNNALVNGWEGTLPLSHSLSIQGICTPFLGNVPMSFPEGGGGREGRLVYYIVPSQIQKRVNLDIANHVYWAVNKIL